MVVIDGKIVWIGLYNELFRFSVLCEVIYLSGFIISGLIDCYIYLVFGGD